MAELTILEAARVVGVDRETVRRWILQGLVSARRIGLRGDYRIEVSELRTFAQNHSYDFDERLAAQLANG